MGLNENYGDTAVIHGLAVTNSGRRPACRIFTGNNVVMTG